MRRRKHKPIKQKTITLAETKKIFNEKVEEFDKMTIGELRAYWTERVGTKNRLGGTYKLAFLEVISKKLQNDAIENAVLHSREENAEVEATRQPEPPINHTSEE